MLRRTALFTAASVVALVLGRTIVLPSTGLALFWPAAGVSTWWMFAARDRRELGTAVGLLSAVITATYTVIGFTPAATALMILANLAQSLGARWVAVGLDALRRRRYGAAWVRTELRHVVVPWDVHRLFLSAVSGGVLSSAAGMAALAANGGVPTVDAALSWLIRNVSGLLLVAGAGMALTAPRRERPSPTEAVSILAVTAGVTAVVFVLGRGLPLGYLLLVPLFWSATRLGTAFAALHAALTSLLAIALSFVLGTHPFALPVEPGYEAAALQVFASLCLLVALSVATTTAETAVLLRDLHESETRARHRASELAAITRTIPDALVTVDRQGDATLLNRQALDVVSGASDGRFTVADTHRPDGSPLPDDERPSARAFAGDVVRGQPVALGDDPAGERVFDVSAAPMESDGADGPGRVLLLLRDSTRFHRNLAELRQARDSAEQLFADAPQGIAVLADDGRITQANSALGRMLGAEPAALVGRRLGRFAAGDPAGVDDRIAEAFARPGSPVAGDLTVRGDDDVVRRVSLSLRTRRSVPGHPDRVVAMVVDVSERHELQERLEHHADHDALTGLVNRRCFDRELAAHVERHRRTGGGGALVLVDLDHFKDVNDTLGHDVGDELLVVVADALRSGLRSTDLLARVGGDEFAVVLPDADAAAARTVAGHLVELVRQRCGSLEGVRSRVTASVGAVPFSVAVDRDADPMALADLLLYDAKDAGRDGFMALGADPDQVPRTGARLAWKHRLRRALDDGAFALHLMPLLDVATGRVVGAEGLVRLVDEGEPVAPGEFLEVAERTGLSGEIDAFVLRTGIALLPGLQARRPGFRLALNLSGGSIGAPGIRTTILSGLDRHRVPPHCLTIEITETAAIRDLDVARVFAAELTARGVRLALDDFGTGYGSFHLLKQLPFDVVKIDGEFVSGADRDPGDLAILRAIVGVARSLGKETVAEYVHSADILEIVRQESVDLAQGFHVGRPLPVGEFIGAHLR